MSSTSVGRHILAPRASVYRALLDADAVREWRVPEGMSSVVHELDPREGGAFRVLLTYHDPARTGKSRGHTDTYSGHFVTLVPDELVVEAVEFDTTDPGLKGAMTITTALVEREGGTDVIVTHDGIPAAVAPTDNEVGTRMALDKLAELLEGCRSGDERPGPPGPAAALRGTP